MERRSTGYTRLVLVEKTADKADQTAPEREKSLSMRTRRVTETPNRTGGA